MKRQGTAYVTVKLTDEQHHQFKRIAFHGQTTMKRLLSNAIERLLKLRRNGEMVEYVPSRRDTKPVQVVVEGNQFEEARAQANEDNVFYTAFYTTALLTILKNERETEVAAWR